MRAKIEVERDLPGGTMLRIVRSPDWNRWPQGKWLTVDNAYALVVDQVPFSLPIGARNVASFRRELRGLTGWVAEPFAFAIVRPEQGEWGLDGPPPTATEIDAAREQPPEEPPP